MSNTTNDKSKYIQAWEYHVSQLNSLGFPLITASDSDHEYYAELKQIQGRLKELIQVAADSDFPEQESANNG